MSQIRQRVGLALVRAVGATIANTAGTLLRMYTATDRISTRCVRKQATSKLLSASLLPNIARFSQFFHRHTRPGKFAIKLGLQINRS